MIGAGAIGLACALSLARAGHSVTVLDPTPMQGASWAAAGMLAPVSEASFGEAELTALNVAAVAEFTDFARQLGVDRSAFEPRARWWWRSTPTTEPRSTACRPIGTCSACRPSG